MGVPTNGRANACRRRLAAKATPAPGGWHRTSFVRPISSTFFFEPSSSPPNRALRPHHQLHPDPSLPLHHHHPRRHHHRSLACLLSVALLSSGPIGPWRSLCFLGARSSQALLQPSRSVSSAHFLLLKAVVLAVADGRRPGRRAAAFPAWLMVIPSDARPTCFHHIERAVR